MLVCRAGQWWTYGCEAHMCSCVEPVTGGLWCGPSQYLGAPMCEGEIVGISPTLVVGGELNQYKSEESLSPLGLAFGV